MKKGGSVPLITITLIFVAFTAGLMLGRYSNRNSVSIEELHSSSVSATQASSPSMITASRGMLNINMASLQELQALPGIGPTLAQRIIDYRTAHGNFGSVYDLVNVEGIGSTKLIRIIEMITVEE